MIRRQRTIAYPVEISGIGLHTGERSAVQLIPMRSDTSISFYYHGVLSKVSANNIYSHSNTSLLRVGKNYIQTIEHLMAAIHGCEIDNCLVFLRGAPELPFLDGSSLSWVDLFNQANIVDLDEPAKYVSHFIPFTYTHGVSNYRYIPSNDLAVECAIDFPRSAIGYQKYNYKHNGISSFTKIANCRTFLQDTAIGGSLDLKKVKERLPGLREADFHSTIVVCNESGFLTPPRTVNEQVKHKILDFLGDIRTIGLPLKGKFNLDKPSHAGNIAFMKELYYRHVGGRMSMAGYHIRGAQ